MSKVTQRFDFAGSMIKSVERFLRGFGATQVPYFAITKTHPGYCEYVNPSFR